MSKKRIAFNEAFIDQELFKTAQNQDENGPVRKMARRALREVITHNLTSRQKQFIMLYYYQNRTMEEIAAECGVNVSTVSRTLRRARNNIMERIKYYFVRTEDRPEE